MISVTLTFFNGSIENLWSGKTVLNLQILNHNVKRFVVLE